MTANFRQFECAICHEPIQYGEYLPFAHTNARSHYFRAHYARPTSSRAAEVGIASPRATREEPQPSRSRPDAAATSQRSRASG